MTFPLIYRGCSICRIALCWNPAPTHTSPCPHTPVPPGSTAMLVSAPRGSCRQHPSIPHSPAPAPAQRATSPQQGCMQLGSTWWHLPRAAHATAHSTNTPELCRAAHGSACQNLSATLLSAPAPLEPLLHALQQQNCCIKQSSARTANCKARARQAQGTAGPALTRASWAFWRLDPKAAAQQQLLNSTETLGALQRVCSLTAPASASRRLPEQNEAVHTLTTMPGLPISLPRRSPSAASTYSLQSQVPQTYSWLP